MMAPQTHSFSATCTPDKIAIIYGMDAKPKPIPVNIETTSQ